MSSLISKRPNTCRADTFIASGLREVRHFGDPV